MENLYLSPLIRSCLFYPSHLAIIHDKDEEHRNLVFSLYSKCLTTEQVSTVFVEVYGKDYSKHQLCLIHLERKMLSFFPHKEKKNITAELGGVIQLEIKPITPFEGSNNLRIFVDIYIAKYPRLKRYEDFRNIAYFTYLEYPNEIQRMIYSTNWIERLNRDYKRVLKMRGAMPTPESVIALMGSRCNGKREHHIFLFGVCI